MSRFGVDDSTGPPTIQWKGVFAYLDGAAAVLGRDNVGIYGGRLAIDKALGAGKARWGWQTSSCRSAAARWTTTGR